MNIESLEKDSKIGGRMPGLWVTKMLEGIEEYTIEELGVYYKIGYGGRDYIIDKDTLVLSGLSLPFVGKNKVPMGEHLRNLSAGVQANVQFNLLADKSPAKKPLVGKDILKNGLYSIDMDRLESLLGEMDKEGDTRLTGLLLAYDKYVSGKEGEKALKEAGFYDIEGERGFIYAKLKLGDAERGFPKIEGKYIVKSVDIKGIYLEVRLESNP